MAAAAAAMQVGQQVKGMLQDMVNSMKAAFGQMRDIVTSTVSAFRPFQVEIFNARMKDLQAVFGQMMLPVMQKMTGVVRQLADYFY